MPAEPKPSYDAEWVFKQFLYEDVLRELDSHFQRLNVGYMPIKGAYLICAGLAKKIKSRTMFDIDILVRESDFQEVISRFAAIPGAAIAERSWPRYKKGWPFEVSFYYPFQGRTINIDIHKLINLRQRFSLPPEDLFGRGTKQGIQTLPCAEDALAICLCHGFSHVANIFQGAIFDDIALLTQLPLDWNKFWTIAKQTGIQAFFYYFLKMHEKRRKVLPIPFPKKTFRFVYADFLIGAIGQFDLSTLPRMLRKAFIELPLCRNPMGLVLNKVSCSLKN